MGGGVGGGAVGRVGGGEEGVGVLLYCHRMGCVESRPHLTSPHRVFEGEKVPNFRSDQRRLPHSTRDLLLCSRCGVQIPSQKPKAPV